ncbi:MAG: thioredoxin family protein [Methylomonas lenta]|nr:thioredoxin family protein [Methylomonas lenta]
MSTAIFYHAGCPVCMGAEKMLLSSLNQDKFPLNVVHLGEQPQRISDAESAGVKSVPALVLDGQVFHINFGAALADLKS